MFARAFLAALIALSVAGAASAEPDPVKLEAAKALMIRGGQLYAGGDYAGALKSYQAAYDLLPNPKIDFNIGQAELKLSDDVAAANAFSAFLDQTLDSADIAAQRKIAREHLSRLSEHLARIQLEIEPASATAFLDGKAIAGIATFTTPGTHSITLSAPGFVNAEESFDLHAAENRTLHLALQPEPTEATAPPPVATPTPEVHDVPKAEPTPAPTPKPAPVAAQLNRPAPHSGAKTAGWILMGTAGAAIVAGAVFGVLAAQDDSQLGQVVAGRDVDGVGYGPGLTRPDQAAADLRSGINRDAALADVGFGVGAVAVGVGLFLLLHHGDAAPAGSAPGALAF